MRKIIVATTNAHKAKEIEDMLCLPEFEVIDALDAGIICDAEEDAPDFVGNALIKARDAHKLCIENGIDACVLADDSGICVDALNGEPGVFSARYAGVGAGQDAINKKLFAKLNGIPFDERTACFKCALAFIDEEGSEFTCEGTVEGRVGFEPVGDEGFGYDPIFFPKEYDYKLSFGQVDSNEKAMISHRARAVEMLRKKLLNK